MKVFLGGLRGKNAYTDRLYAVINNSKRNLQRKPVEIGKIVIATQTSAAVYYIYILKVRSVSLDALS